MKKKINVLRGFVFLTRQKLNELAIGGQKNSVKLFDIARY